MLRFTPLFLTGMTVVTLSSCSAPPAPETKAPETKAPVASTPAATTPKPTAMAFDAKAIAGFKAIQAVVSKTETAVEAGNFADATKDFEGFETNWKTVEDGVMKTSPAFYTAVEKAAKAAEAGLKGKDKPGTIKALKELNNTLQSGSKP
jgi:predicted extracellular nuclease